MLLVQPARLMSRRGSQRCSSGVGGAGAAALSATGCGEQRHLTSIPIAACSFPAFKLAAGVPRPQAPAAPWKPATPATRHNCAPDSAAGWKKRRLHWASSRLLSSCGGRCAARSAASPNRAHSSASQTSQARQVASCSRAGEQQPPYAFALPPAGQSGKTRCRQFTVFVTWSRMVRPRPPPTLLKAHAALASS